MAIFLEPLTGVNLVTKQVQVYRRYKVIDRDTKGQTLLGYVDWDTGFLGFIVQVDPMFEKKTRASVAKIMEREEAEIKSAIIPEQPEEYLSPPEQESVYDEFNESDLT